MATLYVSTTGTNATGDGSEGNPYRNLYYAINQVGSTGSHAILLQSGTYTGEISPTEGGPISITLESVSGKCEDVVVFPSNLKDPGDSAARAWMGRTGTHNITLANISFILDFNNIAGTYSKSEWNTNSIFYVYQGTITASGCYFEGRNLTANGSLGTLAVVTAIRSKNTGRYYLYKNTFRDFSVSGSRGIGVLAGYQATTQGTAIDNIFEGCNVGIQVQSGTSLNVESNNCFYNNGRNYIYGDKYPADSTASLGTPSASSVLADPLFLGTGSPVISASSPCVDAGVVVPGYVESYSGDAPDIGCYETAGENQLLLYTGQYNNGTDTGTVNFSSRVLQIGDITESLMNGAESRGWVMQAAVTLDDSDQFWAGSFAQGNQWLNGTFTLNQLFGSVWTPMLVGYVEPTDYTHDYGNREVSIQITSVLARVSYALVPYGVNERGTYDPYRPLARLMGTVSAVGTDGTVTLEPAEVQTGRIPHHSFIWQDVNGTVYPETGEQARLRGFVPESVTSESGTVREMTFENGVPDWCTVGQVVYASEPWPTQQMLEIEVSRFYPDQKTYDLPHPLAALWYDACRQAGLTFEAASLAEFGTRLAYYQMACTAHVAAAAGYYAGYPWSNGTSPYYYGGEKWTDVLTDLFSSVGANWTVNGAGQVRAYLYQPGAQEPTGSLSFNSAYGDWTAALQEGASEVRVYSDYDPVEGYQGSYSLNTGASGPTVTINARWQRSTGGPLLASRLRFKLGSTGPAFGLVLDGTQWPNYQPGQTWTITDMPAELLPVTGSNLVIASKTYSYMNDTTTLDFITGAETTGIFRTGTIGTAPEPSTLDGTDILW